MPIILISTCIFGYSDADLKGGGVGAGGRTPTPFCAEFFKKPAKFAKKILGRAPNRLRPLLFQILDAPLVLVL